MNHLVSFLILCSIARLDIVCCIPNDSRTTRNKTKKSRKTKTAKKSKDNKEKCNKKSKIASDCAPLILPLFGPEVGGTVVLIKNGMLCEIDPANEIYCRFKGSNILQITSGIWIDKETVQCLTPFISQNINVQVSYTSVSTGCDFNPKKAAWNVVHDEFQYVGKNSGVIIQKGNVLTGKQQLITTDSTVEFKWKMNALKLSAVAEAGEDLKLFASVEVLAFDKTVASPYSPFKIIQEIETPINSNKIELKVNDKDISDFFIKKWGIKGRSSIAIILVRVKVYTKETINQVSIHRTRATRSSHLIGVLQEVSMLGNESCPIVPLGSGAANPMPCPHSYSVAINDFGFTPDKICEWPSGMPSVCNDEFDLLVDHTATCLSYESYNDYLEYCKNIDKSIDLENGGCGCTTFHPGAAGCLNNGQTQCCYSESDTLITLAENGGGTINSFPSDGTFTETIRHYLFDIFPYLYCCVLNDKCESYFQERPTITNNNYAPPPSGALTWGDPHFRSIDRLEFDFNGYGEFVAFCGLFDANLSTILNRCRPWKKRFLNSRETVSVHYRMKILSSSQAGGTVIVGVGIEHPNFRGGQFGLVVETHPSRRLDIYNGDNRINFPDSNNFMVTKNVAGTIIKRSSDEDADNFLVLIDLPSGINVRLRETGGVITSIVTRKNENLEATGLLGRPNGFKANDLTDKDGVKLSFSGSDLPFNAAYTEDIFNIFGNSWMIRRESASLFQGVGRFDYFLNNVYVPSFQTRRRMERRLVNICDEVEDDYIRQSCNFDLVQLGDDDLVRKLTDIAIEEYRIAEILIDAPPEINPGDRNQAVVVDGKAPSHYFNITANDADGDILTATFDRNDNNSFSLVVQSEGVFKVYFNGSDPGIFIAQVIITDGLIPILCTLKVLVQPTDSLTPNSTPISDIPID